MSSEALFLVESEQINRYTGRGTIRRGSDAYHVINTRTVGRRLLTGGSEMCLQASTLPVIMLSAACMMSSDSASARHVPLMLAANQVFVPYILHLCPHQLRRGCTLHLTKLSSCANYVVIPGSTAPLASHCYEFLVLPLRLHLIWPNSAGAAVLMQPTTCLSYS